jgi:hypothetical protein
LDTKFFDPKYAFKELGAEDGKLNALKKKQVEKSKALGYPSDVNVLYKNLPVSKFIEHETPTVLLQHATEVGKGHFLFGKFTLLPWKRTNF